MKGSDVLLDSPAGDGLDTACRREENLTKSSLDAFRQDLRLRGLTEGSIKTSFCSVRRYLTWARERGMDPDAGCREDLLAYLRDLRARGLKQGSLNNDFAALNSWFDYLEENGKIQKNPIPTIRAKYLKTYKDGVRERQLISVEDMAKLVRAAMSSRDRAVIILLAKTGIRRNELVTLDISDMDLLAGKLTLKPTPTRSNRIVFFDEECSRVLSRWLMSREKRVRNSQTALFIGARGERLGPMGVTDLVRNAAICAGLHDKSSCRLEDRFSPHCCRHFWTTHLLRAGMRREYVQWLRGDAIKEAVDIYFHVDPEDVRRSYLAHVPQLGI